MPNDLTRESASVKPVDRLKQSAAKEIQREVVRWLNTCPDVLKPLTFEELLDDRPGMCISTVQAPYRTRKYICGGFLAQYQFSVIFRLQPSDDSEQLAAVELLNQIGLWAEREFRTLDFGEHATIQSLELDNDATILAAYEDGTRDYHITITLNWEVI